MANKWASAQMLVFTIIGLYLTIHSIILYGKLDRNTLREEDESYLPFTNDKRAPIIRALRLSMLLCGLVILLFTWGPATKDLIVQWRANRAKLPDVPAVPAAA